MMSSHASQPTVKRAARAPVLHVRADGLGIWLVYAEGEDRSLSRYGSETDAERAATRRAADTGARDIIVHDRYHRVHKVSPGRGLRPDAG